MRPQGNSSGKLVSAFFALWFGAIIALDAFFLAGCDFFRGYDDSSQNRVSQKHGGATIVQTSPESFYLRDIARRLGIDEPMDKTPGDIAFDIEQRLGSMERYRGEMLSDENANDVKAQILEEADAQIFADYHAFMRKIAGKKIIVIE